MAIRSHLKKSREKRCGCLRDDLSQSVLICGFALAPAIMVTTSLKNAVAMTLAFSLSPFPPWWQLLYQKQRAPVARSVVYH